MYSVEEEDSFVFVCASVLAGSTAGRTISIDYQTTDGDAQGIPYANKMQDFISVFQLQGTIHQSVGVLT